MDMVRVEDLMFGYRLLKVEEERFKDVISILYRSGVVFSQKNSSEIIINERYILKAEALLKEKKIEYLLSAPQGIIAKITNYKHKAAFISASVLTMTILIFLSNIVWDIRVEGNIELTDSEVVAELEKSGLSIGTLWRNVEKSQVEATVLSDNEKLSWININRVGTVAYVVVKEKDKKQSDKVLNGYEFSNIVATEDCVIEDISVTSGIPMVKVGDVVKAGDILILGALPDASGNHLCRAEGKIIGRVYSSVTAEVPRQIEEKSILQRKFSGLSVKIFDFPINIFKTYRNFDSECDIIEEKSIISFFGICNLPIEVTKTYTVSYSYNNRTASDDELINLATYRINAMLYKALSDVDLCGLKTYGDFLDSGYIMRCEYIYTCNVAKEIPIYIKEKK